MICAAAVAVAATTTTTSRKSENTIISFLTMNITIITILDKQINENLNDLFQEIY